MTCLFRHQWLNVNRQQLCLSQIIHTFHKKVLFTLICLHFLSVRMSGHPPGLLSQGDKQSPTVDKKFYNIKYQDPHVGIAVMHTHNPSRCWYACDYHHLHCPNMLIFSKYQDYCLDLHPIPDSFVGQSVKHSYHQPSWWSGEEEAAALTPACPFTHIFCCLLHISTLSLYLWHMCTSYLCWHACKMFTCTVQ